MAVDASAHHAAIGGVAIREGDWLSIDEDTGEVFLRQCEIATERPEAALAGIDAWRAKLSQRQDEGVWRWRNELPFKDLWHVAAP